MAPKNATVKERPREAILDAAARLIAERGYHVVRVADIAREVGTSTGTVHYYFPGKSDVLTMALQHAITKAFERQSIELKKLESGYDRLLKLIDMQLPRLGPLRDEWSVWMQYWAEATIHPELRLKHSEFYSRWREAVVRIVKRGQRQGEFRVDADPYLIALQLTAITDGTAIQVLTGVPDMTVSTMREVLISYINANILTQHQSSS